MAQSIVFQHLEVTGLMTYYIQGRMFEGLYSRENQQVYDSKKAQIQYFRDPPSLRLLNGILSMRYCQIPLRRTKIPRTREQSTKCGMIQGCRHDRPLIKP